MIDELLMANNSHPQIQKDIFLKQSYAAQKQQTYVGVMQDNRAQDARRFASEKPAVTKREPHVQHMMRIIPRSKNHLNNGEKLEKATIYIKRNVKAELQRIADQGTGE